MLGADSVELKQKIFSLVEQLKNHKAKFHEVFAQHETLQREAQLLCRELGVKFPDAPKESINKYEEAEIQQAISI